jgi:predicted AlkP superfamily pyrophosphatase or phosphodiesterase
LGGDLLYPYYQGRSILNLPSSVCRWLGAPGIGAGPLAAELLAPLDGDYQRVILVLMDGLGFHRLSRWMQHGDAPVWSALAGQGLYAPLTSITPSTTSSALTTLWTGRSPTEHGVTGYEMWLKEYGIVANTILHMPITFKSDLGALSRAGFDPETFIPFQKLGTHLAAHGVKTYALEHFDLLDSGLTRMLFKDVQVKGFNTAVDLWINLRQRLHSQPDERCYTWVYWDQVDHLGHHYGPDDERLSAEFSIFSHAMQQLFLDRLSPAVRRDTLLILTADHGQIPTRPDPHYDLRNHPGLTRRLHINPTGENRLAYLYIRPGQSEAVREYIERAWPNQFAVVESGYAAAMGLFGPGQPHQALQDRIGDTLVIARGEAYFWWADKEDRMYGRHGGLHPEEMLVPFLAARL